MKTEKKVKSEAATLRKKYKLRPDLSFHLARMESSVYNQKL